MPSLISSATGDAYSTPFVLSASSDSATLSLAMPSDSDIPPGVEAIVQMQTSAFLYIAIGKLNKDNPRMVLNAPGTYRVFRRASKDGFGVDYALGSFMPSSTRATVTATIASGASQSGVIDLTNTALLGFIAPAGWTAAALNIEVSADNVNWVTTGIIDWYGLAVGSWSSLTAGAAYAVDAASMLPWRYVRFRSGTFSAQVNQGAQRDFTVITRPLA
jgi:hypothetical protein